MCTNIKFVWFGFAILSICVCLVSVWRSISAAYSSFSGDQLPQGRVCVGHPQSVHPAACQFVSSYFCSLFCMIVCLFLFYLYLVFLSILFFFSKHFDPGIGLIFEPFIFFLQVIFVLNRWTFKAMIWFGILFRGIALV